MYKKLEYINNILNLDTDKMFQTSMDKKYIPKNSQDYYKNNIKNGQLNFKGKLFNIKWCMQDAFDYCGMYLTDTEQEAVAQMIIYAMDNDFKVATELLEHINDELIKLGLIDNDKN